MTRLVGPHDCVTHIEAGGIEHVRQPDGTFHVSESMARYIKRQSGGDMTEVGTTVTLSSPGYRCTECGFLAAFADPCGRCGGRVEREDTAPAATTIGPLGVPPKGIA